MGVRHVDVFMVTDVGLMAYLVQLDHVGHVEMSDVWPDTPLLAMLLLSHVL